MVAVLRESPADPPAELTADPAEIESRKAFIGLGPEEARLLRELRPLVHRHADEIVDGFYRAVERQPELLAIIDGAGSSRERLRAAQTRYLLELFEGDYGPGYVARRLRIGVVHQRIGLGPRWYLSSYAIYMDLLGDLILRRHRFHAAKAMRLALALHKLLTFDIQLVLDAYLNTLTEELRRATLGRDVVDRMVSRYQAFISGVAQGDLSSRLELDADAADDDLARLGHSLNDMAERLCAMTREAGAAGEALGTTVDDVLETISAQSAGASEQAAAANETASSLEQIRAISAQTQDQALALGDSATRTREEGERGAVLVGEAIAGMGTIRDKTEGIARTILALSEQTQQIGDITTTVNNLAQQLKMLALNASIEAAKAGEAGKGFAVVASEVKELAEQSQQATDQVHRILVDIRSATDQAVMVTEEGTKGVDEGLRRIEAAGEAVRSLTGVIRETASASQQIVAAVRQEAVGIDQIATAMSEINEATAQFVESTERTRSSAETLAEVASRLRAAIGRYRL